MCELVRKDARTEYGGDDEGLDDDDETGVCCCSEAIGSPESVPRPLKAVLFARGGQRCCHSNDGVEAAARDVRLHGAAEPAARGHAARAAQAEICAANAALAAVAAAARPIATRTLEATAAEVVMIKEKDFGQVVGWQVRGTIHRDARYGHDDRFLGGGGRNDRDDEQERRQRQYRDDEDAGHVALGCSLDERRGE